MQGYLALEKTAFNELGEDYERQQEAAKRALRTKLSRRNSRRRSSRRKLSSVNSTSELDDLDKELDELDGGGGGTVRRETTTDVDHEVPGNFAESSRRRRPSIADGGRNATRRQTLMVDTDSDRFQER